MRHNKPVYGHRRPKSSPIPALLVLGFAVAAALAVAALWQVLDSGTYDPNAFAPVPPASQSSSQGGGSSSQEEPASQSPASDSSSQEESTAGKPLEDALVPEGEWLPSTYFDDALFIGDSITEGIKLYDVMSNATVLSNTGINLSTIFTKACAGEDGSLTIVEAAAQENPGKIYLLMGINSMLSDQESFVQSYGTLVDTLRQQHPDAIFYVQSIFPVTAAYEQSSSAVATNAQIDQYNAALLEMCREKGVYYLNVAEAFKDETGALPNEASPKDGIHFGRSWYMEWFDYLRSHGAPENEK